MPCHIDRIVPGARDNLPRAIAKLGCGLSHQVDAIGIEWLRRDAEQLSKRQPGTAGSSKGRGLGSEFLGQSLHLSEVGMPELDTEAHLTGDDVAAVRQDMQLADRAAPILAARPHQPVHEINDTRRRDQRIAPCRRWGGAGMRVLAGDHGIEPDLRLRAGDDADLARLTFQDRALFDMQFKIGIGGERLRRVRPLITDGAQRLFDGHPNSPVRSVPRSRCPDRSGCA